MSERVVARRASWRVAAVVALGALAGVSGCDLAGAGQGAGQPDAAPSGVLATIGAPQATRAWDSVPRESTCPQQGGTWDLPEGGRYPQAFTAADRCHAAMLAAASDSEDSVTHLWALADGRWTDFGTAPDCDGPVAMTLDTVWALCERDSSPVLWLFQRGQQPRVIALAGLGPGVNPQGPGQDLIAAADGARLVADPGDGGLALASVSPSGVVSPGTQLWSGPPPGTTAGGENQQWAGRYAASDGTTTAVVQNGDQLTFRVVYDGQVTDRVMTAKNDVIFSLAVAGERLAALGFAGTLTRPSSGLGDWDIRGGVLYTSLDRGQTWSRRSWAADEAPGTVVIAGGRIIAQATLGDKAGIYEWQPGGAVSVLHGVAASRLGGELPDLTSVPGGVWLWGQQAVQFLPL